MRTAKAPAPAAESLPSRRSQPVRQTRTNPPRSAVVTTATAGRGGSRIDGTASSGGGEQPVNIFPAVTHFADAITALPKELVKHFTLLKEVDAKIHVPQQALFRLIDTALRIPAPNTTRSPYDGTSTADSTSAMANSHPSPVLPPSFATAAPGSGADVPADRAGYGTSNLPQRQLFHQVATEIKDMLVALEEKNHVISTANDALNKQLARIDDIWPHLEQEFSEEAKWGNTRHWAYPENRAAHRANNSSSNGAGAGAGGHGSGNSSAQAAERSRREGAASLSAAAQQIADDAAARSDARKQAVAARRSQKTVGHHQDSDVDDHGKRIGGSKQRNANGTAAAAAMKRRKTEKPSAPPNSSASMERALSGMYGPGAASGKMRRASTPRGSPAPDGAKKRKTQLVGGSQPKKSRGASATASPVIGAFPDSKTLGRGSPAPMPNSNPSTYVSERVPVGMGSRTGYEMTKAEDETMTDVPPTNPGNARNASSMSSVAASSFGDGMLGYHGLRTAYANGLGPTMPATAAAATGFGVGGASSNSSASHREQQQRDGPYAISGAPPTSLSGLLPSLRDNGPPGPRPSIAAQIAALDARRPSPLALGSMVAPLGIQAPPSADNSSNKQTNGSGGLAGTLSSSTSMAMVNANGTRTPAGISFKDGRPASSTTAPEPSMAGTGTMGAPLSSASAAPTTAKTVPDANAASSLPMEAGEPATPPVAMTRTRSASLQDSKKERDGKDGGGTSAGVDAAQTEVPITVGMVAAKKEKESTPMMPGPLPPLGGGGAAAVVQPALTLESPTAPTGATGTIAMPPQAPAVVANKSGRTSKPSTPPLGTFSETSLQSTLAGSSTSTARPRTLRGGGDTGNGDGSSSGSSSHGGNGHVATAVTAKRSHKKGASSISHRNDHGHGHGHGRSQSASQSSSGHHQHDANGGWAMTGGGKQQQHQQKDQGQAEEDEDDPLYCYCNRVSFGEMIACDAADCKREWFHLECVGLRVAPKSSVKWYCDDCKKRLRVHERKASGR